MNNFNINYVLDLEAVQDIILVSENSGLPLDKKIFKKEIVKNIGINVNDIDVLNIIEVASFWKNGNDNGVISSKNYHDVVNGLNELLADIYDSICEDIDFDDYEYLSGDDY